MLFQKQNFDKGRSFMHLENWIASKETLKSVKRKDKVNKPKKWLSYKEHTVNALALGAEEGRDEHRNASGSCK